MAQSSVARRLAWAVALLIALWVLAWLAVPPLLRAQVERLATEKLGRQVTVGSVDFRPWSLELTLRDLSVAGLQREAPPSVHLERLYINAALQSLVRLAPVVDALELEGPVVRLTRTAPGHYDWDDALAKLQPAPDAPASDPPRFALYNVAIQGGAVHFNDQVVGREQVVDALQLELPFLSNLNAHREVKVAPRLAFTLNGSAFDSSALSTPFLETHHTEAQFRLHGFDLAPFLGYLPADLPARLQSAVVDADVRLAFEQSPAPAVRLSGAVTARQVRIGDAQNRDWVGFDALRVQLTDVQPLQHKVDIGSVTLESPQITLRRDRAGRMDMPFWPQSGQASVAENPPVSAPWQVRVGQARIAAGQLRWIDGSLADAMPLQWDHLAFNASDIAWPLTHPVKFGGSAQSGKAQIGWQGDADLQQAKVALSVQQWPLEMAAPYLAQALQPRLTGTLTAQAGVAWNRGALAAKVAQLSLDGVALECTRRMECPAAAPATVALRSAKSLLELQQLRVEGALINLADRSVAIDRLELVKPRTRVDRDAQGRWMFERWAVGTAAPAHKGAESGASEKPWSVQLDDAAIRGGTVALRDALPAEPVVAQLLDVDGRIRGLAVPAAGLRSSPATLQLAARVAGGRGEPGKVSYDGRVGLSPLSVQGRVQASHVPLHPFEPYVADALNVDIVRADATFRGDVNYVAQPKGPALAVRGDASLDDVRVRSVLLSGEAQGAAPSPRRGDELFNWKSLSLRGVRLGMAPGTPLALDVDQTSLSDFFARVIIREDGRINLQDLRKAAAAEPASASPTAPAPAAPGADGPAPVIRFGPVALAGGSMRFTDLFVKPNYSADLSELAGRLSAFSSVPSSPGGEPSMAELELRGRAQGSAALEVTGQLNPLAKPLALDIRGQMRDLELPPLSPYSVKYAGHGIERGKLSMDVRYRVLPDGQLAASNKLMLNQLEFGEAVPGAPASLPVRLAVALLADRNGVIDVDLPISGSLNDPNFSLAPVIFRVLGNLIMKAVTAPFSLLTGALGGGSESSHVAFAPGSATLDAPARERLDGVAKALAERDALRMTVVGQSRLAPERDAWKRQQLDGMVQAQKRRQAVRDGQAAPAPTVTPQEYPALLKEVYRRADIAKPRSLIGLPKDLPVPDMEALLLASISLPDDAMQALALARGVAVRDYLAARKVPPDRLFIGAAKAKAQADGETAWEPRADLVLSTR